MQVKVVNRRSKYFGRVGRVSTLDFLGKDRVYVQVLIRGVVGMQSFKKTSVEQVREQVAPPAPPVFFEAVLEPANDAFFAEPQRPFIDPRTCELKVGDKVRVVAETHGWGIYDEGDEAVVCRTSKPNGFYGVQKEGEGFVWKGERECFLLLQEGVNLPTKAAPAPAPPKPKPIEPFPLGSEVRIAKESKYYTDGDNVMNPIDVDGEVTKLGDSKKDFYIQVCWGAVTNSYNKEDLVGV